MPLKRKPTYVLVTAIGVLLVVGGTVLVFLNIKWGLLIAPLGMILIVTGGRELYRARSRRKPNSQGN